MPTAFAAVAKTAEGCGGSIAMRSMPAWRANASAIVNRSGAANGSIARSRNENRFEPTASAASARIAPQSSIRTS
jgi:hypothetical protein